METLTNKAKKLAIALEFVCREKWYDVVDREGEDAIGNLPAPGASDEQDERLRQLVGGQDVVDDIITAFNELLKKASEYKRKAQRRTWRHSFAYYLSLALEDFIGDYVQKDEYFSDIAWQDPHEFVERLFGILEHAVRAMEIAREGDDDPMRCKETVGLRFSHMKRMLLREKIARESKK